MNVSNIKLSLRANVRTVNRRLAQLKETGTSLVKDVLDELKSIGAIVTDKKGRLRFQYGKIKEKDLARAYELQKQLKETPTSADIIRILRKNDIIKEKRLSKKKQAEYVAYFNRAIEHFLSSKDGKYALWTQQEVLKNKSIESRGDGLANMFRQILADYTGKEFTQEEIEELNKTTSRATNITDF